MADKQKSVPTAEEVTDDSKLTVYEPHKTHDMVPDETLNFIGYHRCLDCDLTSWDEKIQTECPNYWEKIFRYGAQNTAS